MYTKTLLLALLVASFSSCSTAYKSGQTPDDVYYSPVRPEDDDNEKRNDSRDEVDYRNYEDRQVRMTIRDRRWRYFDDYSYANSPYNYCYCSCNSYTGYYYNPYFYPAPIYNVKLTPKYNSTPRMVNLNAYHNYNPVVAANPKVYTPRNWTTAPSRYNNSNSNNTNNKGLGDRIRRAVSPKNSNSSSTSSSNDRSYSPSRESNSSSSSSSSSNSSSSSSSSSNTRPARGN